FLVDLAQEGIGKASLTSLDPTRALAKLSFEQVACDPLGSARDGERLLQAILDRAAVPVAFEQVGGAERCLETALAFAAERQAFGRTISSYQAIKHKLADVYVKKEIARSNAYYGAWAMDVDAPELPRAAASARVAGTMAYEFAAQENTQTHGGMGFTWEMD